MTMTDQELLGRMLDGDQGAFTALYRRRQAAVFRFALQMSGSVMLAEDVTQEVFLSLIAHGRRFDPERGTLASFLYGIARNLLRRRMEKDRPAEVEIEEFAGGDDPLEDLTRRETIEQVRRAVSSLPATYREAVVLCDLQNLSYQDAADALECPVGTVRSRLNRARAMLARKLGGAAFFATVAVMAGITAFHFRPRHREVAPVVAIATATPSAPQVETAPVVTRPVRRPAPRPREVVTEFFPLLDFAPEFGRGELVRVRVPAETMLSVGLPVREDRLADPVEADLLIGEEGLARAIRFVRVQ
jgi:RNA polymerase sigma-70 factor, ECF subfamily